MLSNLKTRLRLAKGFWTRSSHWPAVRFRWFCHSNEIVPAKPYHSISIAECGEPLLELPAHVLRLAPHPYIAAGADYGGKSPFVLRAGVLDKLERAQAHLNRLKPGWKLLIFDAYRPIAVQRYMVDYTFNQLLAERNLEANDITSEQREALMEEVLQFWAMPSDNPATPPPHSTGAAIDLTLVDESGQPVDMGSPIDEISERSHPKYFQKRALPEAKQFHRHRSTLSETMQSVGLIGHPFEWWHFSYGDQIWAWQLRERYGETRTAIYAAV